MTDVKIYAWEWLEQDKLKCIFKDRNIVHDHADERFIPSNQYKTIYIQSEPEHVFRHTSFLLKNFNKFEYIYTWNEHILNNCPNAKKCLFGTLRTPPRSSLLKKEFKISNFSGSKNINNASGYMMRWLIHYNQHLFGNNVVFFRSHEQIPHIEDLGNNPFIKETKHDLFETFQFSIIIENEKYNNYFSEKLIDCLKNKTIPIYYGCPNIHEYFDTNGWILFHTLDELLIKLNKLEHNYYNNYIDTIEYNYKKCEDYEDYYKNLIAAA